MSSLTTKKDHLLVTIIGILFGFFAIPILENIQPAFWQLNAKNILALPAGFAVFANFSIWIAGIIGKKRPGLFQFAKYAATGAMNSFTDLGIFNFLSMIFQIFSGPLIILLNIVSFSVAVTNSYFWNNLWAFKKDGTKLRFAEYLRFVGCTIGGMVLNTAVVYLITTVIGAPEHISAGLWENVAKFIAVPPTVAWNFVGYKFFVFTQKPLA